MATIELRVDGIIACDIDDENHHDSPVKRLSIFTDIGEEEDDEMLDISVKSYEEANTSLESM